MRIHAFIFFAFSKSCNLKIYFVRLSVCSYNRLFILARFYSLEYIKFFVFMHSCKIVFNGKGKPSF